MGEAQVGPTMSWYFDPLPSTSASSVEIVLAHDTGRSGAAVELQQLMASLLEKFTSLRKDHDLAHATHHHQILRTFGPRPATEIAYEWVQADLREIGWL